MGACGIGGCRGIGRASSLAIARWCFCGNLCARHFVDCVVCVEVGRIRGNKVIVARWNRRAVPVSKMHVIRFMTYIEAAPHVAKPGALSFDGFDNYFTHSYTMTTTVDVGVECYKVICSYSCLLQRQAVTYHLRALSCD